MAEIGLLLNAISRRKLAESGGDDNAPVDDSLVAILEAIEEVKAELKLRPPPPAEARAREFPDEYE